MPKPYPQPHIITCQQWGAKSVGEEFPTTNPQKLLLHHMDTQNFPLQKDPGKALHYAHTLAQDCQAMHMNTNGWSDTGQQFTVTRNGLILEGRHGSIASINAGVSVIGAQCENYNSHSVGVEHEGTYDDVTMPEAQWNASVELFAWMTDRLKLTTSDIEGHRDHCSTDCPGKWLYAQLPKYREAVHAKLANWRAKE